MRRSDIDTAATRRQVMRQVLCEALVWGAIGSARRIAPGVHAADGDHG